MCCGKRHTSSGGRAREARSRYTVDSGQAAAATLCQPAAPGGSVSRDKRGVSRPVCSSGGPEGDSIGVPSRMEGGVASGGVRLRQGYDTEGPHLGKSCSVFDAEKLVRHPRQARGPRRAHLLALGVALPCGPSPWLTLVSPRHRTRDRVPVC